MTLHFPNESRSYDASRHCVRFWGHDGAREISFLVEEDALCRMSPNTSRHEAGLLRAFDHNRDRILQAAGKVYSRRGKSFYNLAASDF
jgi:hypothetical protein